MTQHQIHTIPISYDKTMISTFRRGKGRLWKDETKWIHDRYMAEEQAPKSRQELVALYGYDILTAENPPDAPPRMNNTRRYCKIRK